MFRHVVDNDPRPHYIHQSNLADYNPALPETHPDQGGIAYPVFGGLVDRYETAFDRASAPLVQLTHTQIGQTLAQQNAWAANRSVTAWLQDGRVHVKNAGTIAADVPLTGTTAGAAYGGQKAGWITLAPGAEQVLRPERSRQHRRAQGDRHRARRRDADRRQGHLDRHADDRLRLPLAALRGRRHASARPSRARPPRSTTLAAADEGATLRVVVLAGNWVSSVSQAASAVTGVVGRGAEGRVAAEQRRPGETPATPGSGSGPSSRATKPTHAPDAAEADEGQAGSAPVRGLAQAPAQGHQAGRHARHVQGQRDARRCA